MERVTLTDDVSLSRIVYGMWRLGDDADISQAHVQAKIESCLAQGITTIYGGFMAEEIFGGALRAAPALKDRIEIVTKCDIIAPVGRHESARVKHYDTSRAHITQSVEASLRLMGIETIDLLLIHRPDPLMDHHETGATLDDLVASGKVRSVGVSNFRPWDWELLQSAMTSRLVTNQIEISVLAHHPFTNGDIAFLQRHGIPPMAWSPLAGGALFAPENKSIHDSLAAIAARHDSDVTSLVVAWLMAHPARIMPVMGTNSLQRIASFGAAAEISIDRETWYEIYTIALGEEVA
jgi:predicted oxidoreductase